MHRATLLCLLVGLGVALGISSTINSPKSHALQPIEWLENPRGLRDFELVTETGVFDKESLLGRWTIVSFGFLNCPDICPTSLSELAALAASLAAEDLDKEVSFVFVSVDPYRDSAMEINNYVRCFSSSILGATGTQGQLEQFSRDLGIQYKVSRDSKNYSVAHSMTFSIIDPAGVFRGRFRPGFDEAMILRSFAAA